ncbi:gluconokinase [Loktanella sp. S4079]|nr:gluconokinase [Loktanella sp. S4079]
MHKAIMVMGVSGAGKSTIAAALADDMGGRYLDGDDYHPPSNVAHMAAGNPLTDDMRWPWLDILAQAVNAARQEQIIVFACSALKQGYRDYLTNAVPDLKLAYLDAPYDVVAARLAQRENHYMPTSLLDSQFAALEPPASPDAQASIDQPIADIVRALALSL